MLEVSPGYLESIPRKRNNTQEHVFSTSFLNLVDQQNFLTGAKRSQDVQYYVFERGFLDFFTGGSTTLAGRLPGMWEHIVWDIFV